jgi:hypothetical protein
VAAYRGTEEKLNATRRYRKLEVERIQPLCQLYERLRENPYFDGGE